MKSRLKGAFGPMQRKHMSVWNRLNPDADEKIECLIGSHKMKMAVFKILERNCAISRQIFMVFSYFFLSKIDRTNAKLQWSQSSFLRVLMSLVNVTRTKEVVYVWSIAPTPAELCLLHRSHPSRTFGVNAKTTIVLSIFLALDEKLL